MDDAMQLKVKTVRNALVSDFWSAHADENDGGPSGELAGDYDTEAENVLGVELWTVIQDKINTPTNASEVDILKLVTNEDRLVRLITEAEEALAEASRQPTMLSITLRVDSSAFEDGYDYELSRALDKVKDRVREGAVVGPILDSNGANVGQFNLS